MKTAITEMFGIKYPIICGAMMWLSKPKLCAAVSNAGGMGNLTAGNYATEDEFRNAIRETRKAYKQTLYGQCNYSAFGAYYPGTSQNVSARVRRGKSGGVGNIRYAAG